MLKPFKWIISHFRGESCCINRFSFFFSCALSHLKDIFSFIQAFESLCVHALTAEMLNSRQSVCHGKNEGTRWTIDTHIAQCTRRSESHANISSLLACLCRCRRRVCGTSPAEWHVVDNERLLHIVIAIWSTDIVFLPPHAARFELAWVATPSVCVCWRASRSSDRAHQEAPYSLERLSDSMPQPFDAGKQRTHERKQYDRRKVLILFHGPCQLIWHGGKLSFFSTSFHFDSVRKWRNRYGRNLFSCRRFANGGDALECQHTFTFPRPLFKSYFIVLCSQM